MVALNPSGLFSGLLPGPHTTRRLTALTSLTILILFFLTLNLSNVSTQYLLPTTASSKPIDSAPAPLKGAPPYKNPKYTASLEAQSMAAAGNETLGFSEIRWINVPGRFDRSDAAVLQAYLTGLKLTEQKAVTPDMMPENGRPPTQNPGRLNAGEIGCWRAHANVWSDILKSRSGPTLILESDAMWDRNTRLATARANREFVKFLGHLDSIPLRTGFWPYNLTTSAASPHVKPNPDDPWLSDHWDMLQLGTCSEGADNKDIFVKYTDPDVTGSFENGPMDLNGERGIRVSGGPVCTTAYAISQRGAAKLLMRTSMNLAEPVDMMMRTMVLEKKFLVYNILPVMFAQWGYRENLGMEHRTSDINPNLKRDVTREEDGPSEPAVNPHDGQEPSNLPVKPDVPPAEIVPEGHAEEEKKKEDNDKMSGWTKAMEDGTVWQVKDNYKYWTKFKEATLETAYRRIFSDEDIGLGQWSVEALMGQ